MKVIKIPLHSIIDVITNSSTEIYTFYGPSVEPAKELIGEMLKTFGIDKTVDEIFNIYVLGDEVENYIDATQHWPDGMTEDKVVELYNAASENGDEKPDWFNAVEKDEECGWYEYAPPINSLYLVPRDEKYVELGNKLGKFLYSPDSIECGC